MSFRIYRKNNVDLCFKELIRNCLFYCLIMQLWILNEVIKILNFWLGNNHTITKDSWIWFFFCRTGYQYKTKISNDRKFSHFHNIHGATWATSNFTMSGSSISSTELQVYRIQRLSEYWLMRGYGTESDWVNKRESEL